MFIDLHILQSFSPSNLNRDDTGNPKDSEFGGVRRARISSQCIKRAVRSQPEFAKTTGVDLAVRTRWITRLLVKPLVEAGKAEEKAKPIAEAYASEYCKMEKDHSSVLLFLSQNEIQTIVGDIMENWDALDDAMIKEKAKQLFRAMKGRTSAPDIALFGRMLAEKPELNIDAACQVAHAISTHRVNMEMDFYTAVDELSTEEETGAAMMGVIPFNSACFYRFARIDWDQLVVNLGGEVDLARKTVEGFLRAAVLAIPTGKQNSFAAQNPPDFVLGVARQDGQSWSLANAFEKPVRPDREGGLVAPSISALDSYWGGLATTYYNTDIKPVALMVKPEPSLEHLALALVGDMESWVHQLVDALPQG